MITQAIIVLFALSANLPFGFTSRHPSAPQTHAYGFRSQASSTTPVPANDMSGMYTFLQEGEFVQVSVDPEGKVSGFVSRYGDGDKSLFLDHFFDKASLQQDALTFTTKTVHGVYYEFKGTFGRGEAKSRAQEGYYVIRGILKQYTSDASKKITAQEREVTFKSFPQGAEDEQPRK